MSSTKAQRCSSCNRATSTRIREFVEDGDNYYSNTLIAIRIAAHETNSFLIGGKVRTREQAVKYLLGGGGAKVSESRISRKCHIVGGKQTGYNDRVKCLCKEVAVDLFPFYVCNRVQANYVFYLTQQQSRFYVGVCNCMKNLSNEQVERIKSWAKSAKEESDKLSVVLNGIKKQLSKDTESNEVAKNIDANWKEFVGLFNYEMPHIIWNGTKSIIPSDFVVVKGELKEKRAFREYRLAGGDIVVLETCAFSIEGEKEVNEMTTFKHPSGFEQPIPLRDAEGKIITHTEKVTLVPREKTSWGYTETVINAFIAAADQLMELHK